MKLQHIKRRVQRGFTLVELAIVLVIAGLILVAVLRGTDAIQKAQVERMVSDLRGMQGILLEFQKRNGRLPGDCDNNGILANAAQTLKRPTLLNTAAWNVTDGTPAVLDFAPANRALPGAPLNTNDDSARGVCTAASSQEGHVNLVWNELRRAGIVDSNRLPRELARHSMGDVFLVSTMFDGTPGDPAATPPTDDAITQPAGVIVVYGIPVWMAEAVDASIDGAATLYEAAGATHGAARTGRVRLWSSGPSVTTAPVTGSNIFAPTATAHGSYDGGDRDRDRLISISFQYTPNKLIR